MRLNIGRPPPIIHPGFLQAICEDPDDDAHRLIYADWLDDHGDSDRAEFIRLQCALARMDEEDEAMREREAELLSLHGDAWRAELPVLPNVTWGTGFRRGFVETAAIPNYLAWRNQGLALLAAAPIEAVSIAHVTPNTVRRLARSPGIERVRGLVFTSGNFGDDDLEVLGKTCRLRAFSYRSPSRARPTILRQYAGRILARGRGFQGLRQLSIHNSPFSDEGAALLALAPNLTELEDLRLTHCLLTSTGVGHFMGHCSWSRLRILDLTDNPDIGDGGARILSSCPGLGDVRELHLHGCGVRRAGATALSRSMFLSKLRLLDLGHCRIGSDGLHALMTSSNLRTLRSLDLAFANLTGEDIVALLCSPLGANLRQLDVRGCSIDAVSTAAIAATTGLEALEKLCVSSVERDDLLRQRFGDRITIM